MGTNLRRRLPLVVIIAVCAAAVTAALSAATKPVTGLEFAQSGHWVANTELGSVFHVNGIAKGVDSQAEIPGIEPGSQVVQGETSGFVVGRSRITEFGKSSLTVERTMTPPTGERPFAIEAEGGPYLVYREAGQVVRLGSPSATMSAGTAVGDPVATPDGTLWLHRLDSGVLCRLPKDADQITCPAVTPAGHTGSLTVVGERAVFLDTTADRLLPLSDDGIGRPTPTKVDVTPAARVSPADTSGRIPVLEPAARKMHLLDASGLDTDTEPATPVTVTLPDGEYSGPTASESAVVLLDLTRDTVLTYGPDGEQQQSTPVPPESGDPKLTRGEDKRVYVDGAEGKHVMVVDPDGAVSKVPVVGTQEPDERRGPVAPPPERAPEPEPEPNPEPQPDRQPDRRQDTPRDVQAADENAGEQRQQTPPARPDPPPEPNPEPQPKPEPKPVPASPPGIPANLAADLRGEDAHVDWGAASPNGATVSAYHVSWQPGTDASTRSLPGSARSTVISGLEVGVTYTITVVAQNSAGRGTPATTQVTVPDSRSVTVSRGRTDDYEGCEVPECGLMLVEMRGFEPNTRYSITPYADDPDYNNPGSGQTTDENGDVTFEAFHFEGVGMNVWVVVEASDGSGDSVQSNRYRWESG
ncbi:Fibronectin type III domain-containing protein [Amycolatopsis marina]|uniref:Fibronectin type III domain-containing protein n=1 Tax=Amycolatopsis marina TaxID=490629 RepID=A0A1I1AD77_9PSEU|nr:fibronectin type III domain-containing protein [Amycolatopsis marina]SFB35949.1 Fibronectin type III domain-containing protein [Amycolatopsis marina]